VKKSKANVNSNVQATAGGKPTNNEVLSYEQLAEDKYNAGRAFCDQKKIGYEYGKRIQEGFYIRLMPDGRTDSLVTQFEAAIA
jgi:hypothetical protein